MPPRHQGKTKTSSPGKRDPVATGPGAEELVQDAPPLAVALQEQFERLCRDLEVLQDRQGQLQAQGHFLQQEAEALRLQSQGYLGYLAKQGQQGQALVVSLCQAHRASLTEIQRQQQELQGRRQEQEEALRRQLFQKETLLTSLNSQLEGLRWVQDLREEQTRHIHMLQKELAMAQKQRLEQQQAAKTRLLQEKAAREQEGKQQAQRWAREVEGAAARCLQEHRKAIQQENQELRRELHQLVQRGQELQAYQHRLRQKVQCLSRENSSLRNLSLLRLRVGNGAPGNGSGLNS